MDRSITYFEHRGTGNTARVLELVRTRAAELRIPRVVVPSTGGPTGSVAVAALPGVEVIVVTHSAGYSGPDRHEMPPAVRAELEAQGARVLTTTHAFGGVGRSVRKKFETWQVEELIAQTLKVFGQGTKVAIEVSLMAADAGLVSTHDELIACGGTGHGLDTALVLKPTHAQTFFDIQVLEIICKPRTP